MWRKRRAALFIDFENIKIKVSPEVIASLLAWIEDGKFDGAGVKRKLVRKRIYWNSSAEIYRAAFEAADFDVVLCEKFSSMKNGADIRMTLDVADSFTQHPEISEYILFTTDSDFVPVLQRLTEKSKLSVILVNESNMYSHTAFSIYADVLIPMSRLQEAWKYKRPETKWFWRLRQSKAPQSSPASADDVAFGVTPKSSPPKTGGKAPQPDHEAAIEEAVRAVVRLASRNPKMNIQRRRIEGQLQKIKGFQRNGPQAYFGKKHYQGLMTEIAKRDNRIKVTPQRGLSASVMYVPKE